MDETNEQISLVLRNNQSAEEISEHRSPSSFFSSTCVTDEKRVDGNIDYQKRRAVTEFDATVQIKTRSEVHAGAEML